MSDIIKFPHPVSGCRTEYGSGKSRLIVDACQLSADLYEVMPRESTTRAAVLPATALIL